MMAKKLGSDSSSFREVYLSHYKAVFKVLRKKLPTLGEGKKGFAPPF